jgi:hypothetical protein
MAVNNTYCVNEEASYLGLTNVVLPNIVSLWPLISPCMDEQDQLTKMLCCQWLQQMRVQKMCGARTSLSSTVRSLASSRTSLSSIVGSHASSPIERGKARVENVGFHRRTPALFYCSGPFIVLLFIAISPGTYTRCSSREKLPNFPTI